MEAREYLDLLKDKQAIRRLEHFRDDQCDGRGHAVVIDDEIKSPSCLKIAASRRKAACVRETSSNT